MTGPSDDPIDVYESVPPLDVKGYFPEIDYSIFQVPPTGLSDNERSAALASFKNFIETQHSNFAGFQGNQAQSYEGTFSYLLNMHANNIGDPFESGRYTLNSKFCERAVLDWFAALWNINWPHNPHAKDAKDRYWGYVLTMGFTEGNIYSVYNARDYLKGRMLLEEAQSKDDVDEKLARGKEVPEWKLSCVDPNDENSSPNYYTPVLFYSEDVHYSVTKAGRINGVDTFAEIGRKLYPGQCPITSDGKWPDAVPSHNYDDEGKSGSVIVSDLARLVEFFVSRDYPVLIVANVGTTWKGAYDDVPAINDMLLTLGKSYPSLWNRTVSYTAEDGSTQVDYRRGFWLMVDGALGGPFLPFIEMAYNQNRTGVDKPGPIFDFRNEAVMSIGCSMHKWLGAPWPGGVFMTRTGYQLQPPDQADSFLGTPDTTLGGSRSAFSPMIFWDYISRMSYNDNIDKAVATLNVAKYLETQLKYLEKELGQDLWVARSDLSLTVRFRLVNEDLNYKYSLDTDRYWVPVDNSSKQMRSYSHIFAMNSLTMDLVNQFITELRHLAIDDFDKAFPKYDGTMSNPGLLTPIQNEKKEIIGTSPCKRRWNRRRRRRGSRRDRK